LTSEQEDANKEASRKGRAALVSGLRACCVETNTVWILACQNIIHEKAGGSQGKGPRQEQCRPLSRANEALV